MPRKTRQDKIDESRIGTHHVIARAVRGAFLFGFGAKSAEDYSERREWIGARLKFLASIFLIDVLGYSVMSNHYHAIMRNRPDLTRNLSAFQIAVRIWCLRNESDTSYTSKRRSVSRRSRKVKLRRISNKSRNHPTQTSRSIRVRSCNSRCDRCNLECANAKRMSEVVHPRGTVLGVRCLMITDGVACAQATTL